MTNYDIKEVIRYKKLLKSQENYWNAKLPVEFCIALRTRDILLGRNIADNLAQCRRNASAELVLESEVEAIIQQYFSSYVKNERQIGDFWGIFIEPSEEFFSRYSDFDAIWWPIVLASRENGELDDKLEASFIQLLDLFRDYRNINYWENEDEWEWFFYQYLVFLNGNLPEQACRDGLGIFLKVIIKMQGIVENSAWKIDYGLYGEPLKVWGGQSLISKLRVRIQTADFTRKAMKKLGRGKT